MIASVIEEAVLRKITSLRIPPGASILDVPCGGGALTARLTQMGFNVFAADIEPVQAVLNDHFRFVDLNRQAVPWPDETFDVACSIEGIEHLENPHRFLREIHRVLRPGGRLILTTPNIVSLRSRVRFLGSAFFHKDPRPLNETARHPLHHIGLRPLPMLRYDLHTTGFSLEEVGCSHTKGVSWAYTILVPWMWLYTSIAFRKEKDPDQKSRNREIRRAMFSRSVLLGENLVLVARKK